MSCKIRIISPHLAKFLHYFITKCLKIFFRPNSLKDPERKQSSLLHEIGFIQVRIIQVRIIQVRFIRRDSYRWDLYRWDLYRCNSYRCNSYRWDSYSWDSYRQDSCKWDSCTRFVGRHTDRQAPSFCKYAHYSAKNYGE